MSGISVTMKLEVAKRLAACIKRANVNNHDTNLMEISNRIQRILREE